MSSIGLYPTFGGSSYRVRTGCQTHCPQVYSGQLVNYDFGDSCSIASATLSGSILN